ncbi:MAG TPA: cytidylate kinase-like family protein [Acidimicrobiia bacterium]|nr:cytidylate kinase-like family protein [Acidimicrobiia bacterium]
MNRAALDGWVVTISASYGAGGSVVAPEVAGALRLPFLDRAVPAAVVEELAGREGLAPDEPDESWARRLVGAAARLPALIGASVPQPEAGTDDVEVFRADNERRICEVAEGGGGVVLGRGAAAFLSGRPRCLHVRLDGPLAGRIARGRELEGLDEPAARRRQQAADRARALYSHRFYDRDVEDPDLYHVMLDSILVPLATCVDMITLAALAAAGPG